MPDDVDDEDEDVAKAEDELEGEEVDAEAMEFDVDADLADDPPVTSSPTRVPNLSSTSFTQFIALEKGVATMHKEQWKFFQEMRTFSHNQCFDDNNRNN
ncbi:hypothetical protein CJ030_MR1G023813 [Morella rubra]|uniref:Uncharacterized protein n=1 Tax=Morella rubra TaxID=262757 RepID=A0A6A1WQ93_9ROSI|nr:hypothetical protein CJ030_MR1G023813 [Morella rubra]